MNVLACSMSFSVILIITAAVLVSAIVLLLAAAGIAFFSSTLFGSYRSTVLRMTMKIEHGGDSTASQV